MFCPKTGVARSLLTKRGEFHCERPPVVSVTPDIIVSPSLPAPPRARADHPPASDSFASLVDSNPTAAANNNERAQDTASAPQPASSDRRAAPARRDEAAAADSGRCRSLAFTGSRPNRTL